MDITMRCIRTLNLTVSPDLFSRPLSFGSITRQTSVLAPCSVTPRDDFAVYNRQHAFLITDIMDVHMYGVALLWGSMKWNRRSIWRHEHGGKKKIRFD